MKSNDMLDPMGHFPRNFNAELLEQEDYTHFREREHAMLLLADQRLHSYLRVLGRVANLNFAHHYFLLLANARTRVLVRLGQATYPRLDAQLHLDRGLNAQVHFHDAYDAHLHLQQISHERRLDTHVYRERV